MDYIMISGHDYKDYLLFNADLVELTKEPIDDDDLQFYTPIVETDFLNKIYSQIWSCGLLFAFVIIEDGILLLNINSKTILKCKKHTKIFFKAFEDLSDEIHKESKNKKPHK